MVLQFGHHTNAHLLEAILCVLGEGVPPIGSPGR